MASTPRKITRPRSFTLGGEQAEADPLLHDGFYDSSTYGTLLERDDPRCFFVGRTGAGKSALLRRLNEDEPGRVISIDPENLSLPYIANLNVMRFLDDLEVHLDPLFIALWKHVLLVEVIKHRYNIDTPTAKQNIIGNLRHRISRDRSKIAALDYLEEFEGRFWCEADERVREITKSFEHKIQAAAGGSLNFPGITSIGAKTGQEDKQSIEEKREYADRFQRVVNETQLPRLNQMMTVLDDDILESEQNFTYIVIDDLDRDWADSQVSNALIRCLFRAVVDMKRVRNLKVVVALRTNIFESLDFGSKTGAQEEKFRSLTMHLRWNRSELEALLSERARAAAVRSGLQGINGVMDLLPATNKTRGNALDFILRRTLQRPRDAISYFNECYATGTKKPKINWDTIHGAEREYSKKRLLALRDEWKAEYPGLHQVFDEFANAPVLIDQETFLSIIDNITLLPADRTFSGSDWLTSMTEGAWRSADANSISDRYFPLIDLLYSIGFLGISRVERGHVIFAEEDDGYGKVRRHIDDAVAFLVHPAYRATLDIHHT